MLFAPRFIFHTFSVSSTGTNRFIPVDERNILNLYTKNFLDYEVYIYSEYSGNETSSLS